MRQKWALLFASIVAFSMANAQFGFADAAFIKTMAGSKTQIGMQNTAIIGGRDATETSLYAYHAIKVEPSGRIDKLVSPYN